MWLNLPNALTILRMLLIPFYLWHFLRADTPADYRMAAGILLLSGLTDVADGWIARRFNMATQLGRMLDPVADKLTLFAVMAALWISRPALRPVYLFFLAKEVLMLAGGWILHRRRTRIGGSRWFGKLATVVFYLEMVLITAAPSISDRTVLGMLSILLVLMLFALVQYARIFRELLDG